MHGLGGASARTWTKDQVLWPRDLLPQDIPNARIMTVSSSSSLPVTSCVLQADIFKWGYDSKVMSFFTSSGRNGVLSHALTLLQDLANERDEPELVCLSTMLRVLCSFFSKSYL